MTSALEAVTEILKNFTDDEPKPPLHVGEVMNLWTSFTAFHEAHVLYQVGLNSTTDSELKDALNDAYSSSKADTKKIEDLMLKEGIPLPTISTPKPQADPLSIPEGVKLSENEIANVISVKVASSIVFCAQAASTSVRTDVSLLFFTLQVNLMKFAVKMKNLMRKRGWLNVPPNYKPKGVVEKD